MRTELASIQNALARRFPDAISTEKLVSLATLDDLIDYLAQRVGHAPPLPSLKEQSQDRVRHLLAMQLHRPASEIGPRTRLESLMPEPAQRRRDWKIIRDRLAIPSLPLLARPRWMEWLLAAGLGAAFLGLLALAVRILKVTRLMLPATLLGTGVVCLIALLVTERWAMRF